VPNVPPPAPLPDSPLPPVTGADIPTDSMPSASTLETGVAPEPAASLTSLPEDDIFELVDRADSLDPDHLQNEADPSEDSTEIDFTDAPSPESVQSNSFDRALDNPLPPASPAKSDLSEPSVFTREAATATLGAFSKLSDTILLERKRAIEGATVTLEDIVKDLLNPLLREWIDHHVPALVDRLVREELDKIARQTREG
jgi:uncharacterized protein